MDDSIAIKTPYMSSLKNQKGEKYALAYIKMWLVYLQSNLGVKNKLSDEMVDLASETILEDYWYASIGDVKIIVLKALKGGYGEFYESITIPKILSWFDSYFKVKFDKCENISLDRHSYSKNERAGWKDREREFGDVKKKEAPDLYKKIRGYDK